MQLCRLGRVEVAPGHGLRDGGSLPEVEGLEDERVDGGDLPHFEQPAPEAGLRRRLPGAQSADQEQRSPGLTAQEVVQPLQRVAIAPVEVIQQQDQRLVGRPDRVPQRFEQPRAAPRLGARGRLPVRRELGEDAGHVGAPDQVQRTHRLAEPRRPEPLGHGRQRQQAIGGPAPGPGRSRSLARGPFDERLREARLADSRLTGDQHDPGAVGGARPRLAQPLPLGRPADQRDRRGRSALLGGEGLPFAWLRRLAPGDPLVQRAGLRRRLETQLPLQDGRAVLERPQRPGTVAAQSEQADP